MIVRQLKRGNCLNFITRANQVVKEWRVVRPYMILSTIKKFKNSGLPIKQLKSSKRQSGHYLINGLEMINSKSWMKDLASRGSAGNGCNYKTFRGMPFYLQSRR